MWWGDWFRLCKGDWSPVGPGRLVPVSRGSRGLSLNCSWRGRSRVEAGALVPVVAGTLVPVEAGALVPVEAGTLVPVEARILVPVEARRLAPVFHGKPGPVPILQKKAVDTTTVTTLPVFKCTT